jgi:hypothetical protein
MSENTTFGDADDYKKLAEWLQGVLEVAEQEEGMSPVIDGKDADAALELVVKSDYHVTFYQQLPDFIMALLTKDPLAPINYAPLLYHLASCRTCHNAYLDLYDAMRAAIYPRGARPLLGQGTRTLSATPHRMLGHLCQVLISQAEALLYQSRHDHQDRDAAARSLLQLALRVSAPISQSSIRRQALQDLVRVASLFNGAVTVREDDPDVHTYTAVLAGSAGTRRGKGVLRAHTGLAAHEHVSRQEDSVIHLQSRSLTGSIVQKGDLLELHLQGLAEPLRGRFVMISVLLGSLLEPVRWLGGNPQAMRSSVQVDEQGILIMPVGNTELRISNPEERNLLEAIFMLLEVRAL